MIEVKEVRKSFREGFLLERKEVLHGISFNVKSGAVVGLLGPNGAGKTTTIKIIMGISPPDEGEVLVFGKKLSKETKKAIGFLPEAPYFYDYLTGREILRSFSDFYQNLNEEKINEVLKLVGLKEEADRMLRSYSKGMLQRIGLAQALLHDPELLIFDEPMSGLDPIGRKEFRDVITSLKEKGKTILFSSHILQDVEMICDEVIMIYRGKVIKIGVLNEMLKNEVTYYEVTVEGTGGADNFSPLKKSGGRFLYRVKEGELDGLIRSVMENGGRIRSVIPRSLTLEEIFIREVKKV